MKQKKRSLYFILTMAMLLTDCTDHRDLYTKATPMLEVKNDWESAQINAHLDGATVLFFGTTNQSHYMQSDPERTLLYILPGTHDVMVFNGLYNGDNKLLLENIDLEGSSNFYTLTATIKPTSETKLLRIKKGEVFVKTPDTLATLSISGKEILDEQRYAQKYINGKGNFPSETSYTADSISFIPCRITHVCEIYAHITHARSLNGANIKAVLRGFVQKVSLHDREPDKNSNVTQQFGFNSISYDNTSKETGTLNATFSTFGPPFEDAKRQYELEIYVRYASGNEAEPFVFDITDQMAPITTRLKAQRDARVPIPDPIVIHVAVTLDEKEGIDNSLDVSIGDWNDIIVTIPFS